MRVITHAQNQGKGAAIRTGLEAATGDLVLIQDADLEYDPDDWPRLLDPMLKGKASVVYGSRFTGERKNMLPLHWFANRVLSFTTNLLYSSTLSDMETCYKLFDAKAIAGHHHRLEPLRLRARDHGQGPPPWAPHLRGADLLRRTRSGRGEEDHVARRLQRAGRPRALPLCQGLLSCRGALRPPCRVRWRLSSWITTPGRSSTSACAPSSEREPVPLSSWRTALPGAPRVRWPGSRPTTPEPRSSWSGRGRTSATAQA